MQREVKVKVSKQQIAAYIYPDYKRFEEIPNFITLSGVIEEEPITGICTCPQSYIPPCPMHTAAPHPEKCKHGKTSNCYWCSADAPLPLAKEIEELPKRKERVGESFGDIVADGLDAHEDKINEIVRYLRRHTGR